MVGLSATRSQLAPLARRPAPSRERRAATMLGLFVAACALGALVPLVPPARLLVGLFAGVLVGATALRPATAAYVLIGVTPLVAGIDRGLLIPVLRPNEALLVLVAAGLLARGVVRAASGPIPRLEVDATDASILLLALASSLLPLAWMAARGRHVEQDDLLYALMMWKYLGVYLIARVSVRTERQVRRCLWIAMISAALVAILAVLQSLQLFGVPALLSRYYTPYGNAQALLNNRGGSTLALPIVVADLLTFNLAIAVGLLVRRRGPRWSLVVLGTLFVVGAIAAGQFSGVTALLLGVVVLALVTRRVRWLLGFVPAFFLATYTLRPVIERRLSGFGTASGLPVSWVGRLHNLRGYFWPSLFSDWNFVLGVRPAARVATSTMATGYIWIESGYTWLLWSGGIPLLLAFVFFLLANLRRYLPLARTREDAVGVAALAVVVALAVVGVLMVIDPHLTYRGSADLLFALLGLVSGARWSDADAR
jgi:hypothetical protein